MSTIQLREANIESIKDETCTTVFAAPGSGKTTFLHAVAEKRNRPRNVVFCGNRSIMPSWGQRIHPLFVHYKNLGKFESIVRDQQRRVAQEREEWLGSGRSDDDFQASWQNKLDVYFDDLSFDSKFMRSKVVSEVACNRRHYGITMFISAQKFVHLTKESREMLSYVAVLDLYNEDRWAQIKKEFLNGLRMNGERMKSHQIDEIAMEQTDGQGNMLWIDNTRKSNDYKKRLFWFHFDKPSPKRVSKHWQHKWARNHYVADSTRKKISMLDDHHMSRYRVDSRNSSLEEKYRPEELRKMIGTQRAVTSKNGDTLFIQRLPAIGE